MHDKYPNAGPYRLTLTLTLTLNKKAALACCRFWTDQFLAGYNSLPGSNEPTIGIDYDGRLFQVLGDGPNCGWNCWGMDTTTGFIQVIVAAFARQLATGACRCASGIRHDDLDPELRPAA